MAKVRKNSRRQKLVTLPVGAKAIFPRTSKSVIKAQLQEIKDTFGQSYTMATTDKQVTITRLS